MFLASARKGTQNGWHEIGPTLPKNVAPFTIGGRALTRDNEIVEKDRGLKWFDHRRGNGDRNGGIRGAAQSREGTGNEDY